MTARWPWLAPASALRIALDELERGAAWLGSWTSAELAGLTTEPLEPLVQPPDGEATLEAVLARIEQARGAEAAAAPRRRYPGPALPVAPPAPSLALQASEAAAAATRRPPAAPAPAAGGNHSAVAGADLVRALLVRRGPTLPAIANRHRAPHPDAGQHVPVPRARATAVPEIAEALRGLAGFAVRIPGGAAASARPLALPAPAVQTAPTDGSRPASDPRPAQSLAAPRHDRPGVARSGAGAVAEGLVAAIPVPVMPASIAPDAPGAPAAPRGLGGLLDWWADRQDHPDRASPAAPSVTVARGASIVPTPPAVADTALAGPVPPPAAGDPPAPEAVARVLERVLIGELRRHGIPLEDP